MNDKNKIANATTINYVQSMLRSKLTENFVGRINPESVRKVVEAQLKTFQDQGILSPEESTKVEKVRQLWAMWSLKEKLKWIFYNKFPIIKSLSNKYRKLTQEYNSLVFEFNELHPGDVYERIELPEHLIPDPKTVVVADIQIRPVATLDMLELSFELREK